MYIAFGDSNKLISIYPYQELDNSIKKSGNSFGPDGQKEKFQIYSQGESLPKLILDYHNDSVNALAFTKVNKYFLVSGASDKCVIIWKILSEGFTYEKLRVIKSQSDITDLSILANDEYIFSGCVDNNIYIWRSNFVNNSFELVNCVNNLHNNFITSICLDPTLKKLNNKDLETVIATTGIRFASYSDDGRLVIAETALNPGQGFRTNILKDYKEFVNIKNKINQIQKKIE